jgi:hypothetical protein
MSSNWNPIPDRGWNAPAPEEAGPAWEDFAEFDSLMELEVVRGLLDSAGIESFWPDEFTKRSESRLLLRLHPEDVETARALLDAPPDANPEASNDEDE